MAINPSHTYVMVKLLSDSSFVIVAKDRLDFVSHIFGDFEEVMQIPGMQHFQHSYFGSVLLTTRFKQVLTLLMWNMNQYLVPPQRSMLRTESSQLRMSLRNLAPGLFT